jgi:DNA-binding transcriptional LysR family regulator
MLAYLAEQGLPPEGLNVAMELGCPEAVVVAVESGFGISFVSRVAVQRSLQLGKIKTVAVEGTSLCRTLYMARNKACNCTRAQVRFRDFIQSEEGQRIVASLLAPPSESFALNP